MLGVGTRGWGGCFGGGGHQAVRGPGGGWLGWGGQGGVG